MTWMKGRLKCLKVEGFFDVVIVMDNVKYRKTLPVGTF